MGTLIFLNSVKAFAVLAALALVFSVVGFPTLAVLCALMTVSAAVTAVFSIFVPGFGE